MSETQTPAATAATAAPAAPVVVSPFTASIDAADLKRALRLLRHARAGKRPPHPAFNALRLEGGSSLRLAAYGVGDVEVHVEIVGAGASGSAALDFDALDAAAKRARKGGAVAVAADGDAYRLEAGGVVTRAPGILRDELPELLSALEPRSPRFTAPAADFARALATVRVASAEERMRYSLRAVHVEVRPEFLGAIPFVATDGRRLHNATLRGAAVTVPESIGRAADLLLPVEAVDAAVAAWDGRAGFGLDVTVTAGPKGTVEFAAGGVRIVGRLQAGQFPNWRDIIPGKGPHAGDLLDVVTLDDPAAALAVLRAAAKALPRDCFGLKFTVREGGIDLESIRPGLFSASLPCSGWFGDPVTFGANPEYVADAIESGADRIAPMAPTVRKGKREFCSPFLLSCSPASGSHALEFRAVVMPVSLG